MNSRTISLPMFLLCFLMLGFTGIPHFTFAKTEQNSPIPALRTPGQEDSLLIYTNGHLPVSVLSKGLLLVEGFENPARGTLDLPHRREVLVFVGNVTPTLTFRVIRAGTPVSAHPFWGLEYVMDRDSSRSALPVDRFAERGKAALQGAGSLFATRITNLEGFTIVECSIPVLLWNEAERTSSVIEIGELSVSPASALSGVLSQDPEILGKIKGAGFLAGVDLAKAARGKSLPSSWLKTFIRTDGIYRLDRNWFLNKGVDPATLPVASLRLQRKGEDVPLGMVGLDDGVFDSGDYLYFFGTRNYDDPEWRSAVAGNEEMKRYLDKYGDSTAYLVTWEGDSGPRISPASPLGVVAMDTLHWQMDLIRSETNANFNFVSSDVVRQQISDWTSEDTWYNGNISQSNKTNYNLALTNLYPGIDGRAWVKYLSWSSFALDPPWHRVGLSLNAGPVLDSTESIRDVQNVLSVPLAASTLKEGTNALTVHNLLSARNTIATAFAEIDYPRRLRATSNRLILWVRDARMTGARLVAAGGFTDTSVAVLRIRDGRVALLPRTWVRRDSTWTCLTPDSLYLGDKLAFGLLRTASLAPSPTLVSNPRLEDASNAADYLLITTKSFEPAASEYAAFVSSSYNVAVKTVYVEDVYDEFGHGMFSPEAIKTLLSIATSSWSTRPRYALFFGDANYNYKATTAPYPQNFVPSWGYPVGDGWFAQLLPGSDVPTISIGRVPARSQAEVREYLRRHQEYLAAPWDEWNKRSMLFSGGKGTSEAELAELRNNNQALRSSLFDAAPMGSLSSHFYKTLVPQSDFGPVSGMELQRIISQGALFISYLGHSGTQTWDNSIGSPSQLANTVNRYTVITDFGCSTGKFAEPDIACFAEMFTLDKSGQAIAYVGNSALGFTSLTQALPQLFYSAILRDSVTTLGDAHRLMKTRLLTQYGGNTVNLTGIRSNTLFADPILRLALPPKPNLVIRAPWSWFATRNLTDRGDSVRFGLVYANLGRVRPDSLRLTVEDWSADSMLVRRTFVRALPLNFDTLTLAFPVRGISGSRAIKVALDPAGEVDELYETDNTAEFPYSVTSGSLQVLNVLSGMTSSTPDSITVLNPSLLPASAASVHFSFSDTPDFTSPRTATAAYGEVFTRLHSLPTFPAGSPVYWKADLDGLAEFRVGPFATRVGSRPLGWLQADSADFRNSELDGATLGVAGVTLGPRPISIRVISSGYFDGNFAVIEKNGINLLPNSFGYQYSVVVLDSSSLEVKRKRQFVTWSKPAQAESLSVYLKAVTFGEIPVITTSDEPLDSNNPVRSVMRGLGSWYIDSVKGWSSWAMIGRPFSRQGTVPEGFRLRGAGRVEIDTVYVRTSEKGRVISPPIGPAWAWKSAVLDADLPSGTSLTLTVLGIRKNLTTDTLFTVPVTGMDVSLNAVDAAQYPFVRLVGTLSSSPLGQVPTLRSWGTDFTHLPELAMNYQSVTVPTDTVNQSSTIPLELRVVNPGPAPAAAFSVTVEVIDQDNVRTLAGTWPVTGLAPDASFTQQVNIPVPAKPGRMSLVATADAANSVDEQFENNNSVTLPLVVRGDTSRPSFDITLDGSIPMDGDYVRPTPELRMRIFDSGDTPITDLRSFLLYLNDTLVTKPGNPSVQFHPGTGTEKASITFTPVLENGEHIFRFNAVDGAGNKASTEDQVLRVWVELESSLLNVMNYPNPFAESTAFTFHLTGVRPPDQFDLKIYTTAGRLIRVLNPASGSPRIGFNSIPWDGKDADGDRVANGLYFYKITAVTNGEKKTETGKLSVAR